MDDTAAIVLAAGKGTRIGAVKRNKVTYKLNGKPMVSHTIENLKKSGISQIVTVVGFNADSVREALKDSVDYVTQDPPQGTGDAVKVGLSALKDSIKNVIIVYGDDSAFYPPELYQDLVKTLRRNDPDMIVVTLMKDDPTGLGRIVRDEKGNISKIVEEKVASDEEKQIKEINTAMSCVDRVMLDELIGKIQKNPVSGEYYFTDIVEIAIEEGRTVMPYILKDPKHWHGVNTKEELLQARLKYKDTK